MRMSAAQRPTQRQIRDNNEIKAPRNATGRATPRTVSPSHKPALETIDNVSSIATAEVHEPAEISGSNHVVDANDIYSYADDVRAAAVRPNSKDMTSQSDHNSRPGTSHPPDLKTEPLGVSGQQQDAGEILRLMRATGGLMHGSFFYRYGSDQPWTSSSGYISPQVGSLLHYTGSKSVHDALVPDLRASRVTAVLDAPSQQIFLRIRVRETRQEVDFCPRDTQYFNAWFAALLAWQYIPPPTLMPGQPSSKRPRLLSGLNDAGQQRKTTWKENQTLRQESIILLEPSYSPTATSVEESHDESQLTHAKLPRDVKRIRSLCLLRGSGLLSLYVEAQNKELAAIQIKDLPRSAIQRADYSIFHSNYVIIIRPRCSAGSLCGSRIAPLYISCPTRESLETWIVLMQTLALPEVYGSQRLLSGDELSVSGQGIQAVERAYQTMIRMKHTLTIRLNKVRLFGASKRSSKTSDSLSSSRNHTKYYMEILLDHQMYIVTNGHTGATDKLHFFENHTFQDLPTQFSTVTVRLRKHEQTRPAAVPESQSSDHQFNESFDSLKIQRVAYVEDEYCGEVVLESHALGTMKGEQKLPLIHQGESTGELTFEVEYQEEIIMMEPEYEQVVDLFERMPVALSLAYSDQARPSELPKLAEQLLNVYLVSGNAVEWLTALAEREILGPAVDSMEQDTAEAPGSSQSTSEQAAAASHMVLLFRGNTLFTKALDLYMKRLGQTYLETTLSRKMREIAIYEPECEVDPSKLATGSLDKNWRRLIDVTTETWQLIYRSAEECPMELRLLFRRIRDYACQRYGASAPKVRYTSVSGFLFLRFFAAATLNPHLFGLIEDDTANSAPTAHRCFILVAKSLQGLANMTTFGNKESWMAPMDQFASGHREEFKNFIDTICDVDESYEPPPHQIHLIAHSATRSQYMHLSPAARDGIPSLPYLIDRSRDIAALVRIWINHTQNDKQRPSFTSTRDLNSSASIKSVGADMPSFNATCLQVYRKTQQLFDQVDREHVDTATVALSSKWATISERMETRPHEFWVSSSAETKRTGTKVGEASGGKLPFFRKSEKDRNPRDFSSKATSQGSSGALEATEKKSRKKSPPRNAPDNAMRKLGWI